MDKKNVTGREPRIVSDDGQRGKRRLSLRRLGTMLNMIAPDSVSLDAIREMIRSDAFHVRYNAAQILAKRADRDARLIIEDALETGAIRTRASVARILYGFSWYSAEPMVINALKDDDPRVRESVVYALCDMQHYPAYQTLVDALENEDDGILEAAAFGLRETQDGAAVPVLQKVLKAIDPDVRVKGLEALGMCGAPEAIPIVREALFDAEPEVKYAAVLSLLELAGADFLVDLVHVIGRTSGLALEQILKAFFHASNYLKLDIANSSAADLMLDALETALLDEYPAARMAAIWSLAWLRHERTPTILQKTYRREINSDVKAHIVRVAASLMSEASEAILEDALSSEDEVVQQAAQSIIDERERTGIILSYDDNAYQGQTMDRSMLLGRLDKRR